MIGIFANYVSVNNSMRDEEWTPSNNPHPNKYVSDTTDEDNPLNWYEWDKNSYYPVKCYGCIQRKELGTGNCVDGGEYWICREKKERTIQTKLI